MIELEVLGVFERHDAVGGFGTVLRLVGTADPADIYTATTLGIQLAVGQQHGAPNEFATVLVTHRAHIVDCPQLFRRNATIGSSGCCVADGDFDLEVVGCGVLGEFDLGDVLGTKNDAQGVKELEATSTAHLGLEIAQRIPDSLISSS